MSESDEEEDGTVAEAAAQAAAVAAAQADGANVVIESANRPSASTGASGLRCRSDVMARVGCGCAGASCRSCVGDSKTLYMASPMSSTLSLAFLSTRCAVVACVLES